MTEPRHRPLAFYVVVYGNPAPKGSKRHVGGGRMVEQTEATLTPWMEAVKHAARTEGQWGPGASAPLDGPLQAEVVFTMRKPASAPKRRRTWPTARPDAEKLARGAHDALTQVGIWRDDALVVDQRARKVFPGEDSSALDVPGCVIRIWKVVDDGPLG